MIAIVARCWSGLAEGTDEYALVEEGRSKLLLASVPGGTAAADEVSKRIELWERSEFEALLQRCEQQELLNQNHRKRKRQRRPRATHGSSGRLPRGHIRPGVVHDGDV